MEAMIQLLYVSCLPYYLAAISFQSQGINFLYRRPVASSPYLAAAGVQNPLRIRHRYSIFPEPFIYMWLIVFHNVLQISTLINHHNECTTAVGMGVGSARALRAVARVGQAVNLAVDRFVTVGETIADDNPEIRDDMYDSCKEARSAGEQYFLFTRRQTVAISLIPLPKVVA